MQATIDDRRSTQFRSVIENYEPQTEQKPKIRSRFLGRGSVHAILKSPQLVKRRITHIGTVRDNSKLPEWSVKIPNKDDSSHSY